MRRFCSTSIVAVISILGLPAAIPGLPAAIGFAEEFSLEVVSELVENHCLDCHNADDQKGGLNLAAFDVDVAKQRSADWDLTQWELIVRRLAGRQMPPPDYSQPDEAEYVDAIAAMKHALDSFAEANPQPGRTESMRRLTRAEYRNAIRDLLGVEINVAEMLPVDQSSHGFDNVTVGELSPTLLNRYISAAEKISRMAVAADNKGPDGFTVRVPPDLTQQDHVDGLPLGTRGGVVFKHQFTKSGEYEIRMRLARDRDEKVEGLDRKTTIDVLIDSERRHRFTVDPPKNKGGYENRDFTKVDAHLKKRFSIDAGEHEIGVTFPRRTDSLLEIKRQPFDASFNRHRHPRVDPAILQVSVTGPFSDGEETDSTNPIRDRLFVCYPKSKDDEAKCATQILSRLMRLAYRRPVTESDLASALKFFDEATNEANKPGGFDAGIQSAVAAILVNPNFLFRIERDPPESKPGSVYSVSDLELASRLSFFLWSSGPDETLLKLTEANQLREPETLRAQVRRMIADDRSRSLVDNFASQWLYLRNLASITPDLRAFPDFDHNLREAFQRETELLFTEVLENDLSVMRMIDSDVTWLNERLAKHYGIDGVRGSHFRRVSLPDGSRRGGILRHGSVLMLTSYATRTSPTVRGNWILENVLGTPPPPPPPNIPSLKEKTEGGSLSVRDRLAQHRKDPACASCHNLMDPVGFSLDNFDAVGRWRFIQDGVAVDSKGAMPDGTELNGVDDLEAAILARPEMFVGTFTEKLMIFALGRGLDPTDAPAIRKIVREAADKEYRMAALLEGIVLSPQFRMRSTK